MYQTILSEEEEGIQVITINREDKMNALNIQLLQELGVEIRRLQSEAQIRAIIITGKGQKAFAAGADIVEFANFSSVEAKKMSMDGHEVFNGIEKSRVPVLAAVNGYSLGGGCELAMACHIRFASENAKFGQPEVNLGVPPGYGGTQRLAQIVGKGRALDLLISARTIDAQTALDYGLVSEVFSQEELMEKTRLYATKLKGKSPNAIKEVIGCVNALYSDQDGFEFEIDSFSNSFEMADFKEGTKAFIEKRKPSFN